jgi:hypothetical protein
MFTFVASTVSTQVAFEGQFLSERWHASLGVHGAKACPAQLPAPLHRSGSVQAFPSSQVSVWALGVYEQAPVPVSQTPALM